MARTCIICGNPAGSREHIFPAALGGRRTNKGIYCGTHNEAYSGLAGIITGQLAFFNAQLGIIGDHADKPRLFTMKDLASGQDVEFNNLQIRFSKPQIISQETVDQSAVYEISFNNEMEAKAWLHEQKAKGIDIRFEGPPQRSQYHIGTMHSRIKLGGDEEGLRAIGYIAQTFLAHFFPEIARLRELHDFKNYTLNNIGTGFAWWDFDVADDLPRNKFPFGHRVIVGLDKENGTAYARISLFSTLNFAILFSSLPIESSKSVISDIDPQASSPPNDFHSWEEDNAKLPVYRPNNLSSSLADAIKSGKAQSQIAGLIQRITEYELQIASSEILGKISTLEQLPESEIEEHFAEIISSHKQRVFKLLAYVVNDYTSKATNPIEHLLSELLNRTVAFDPQSSNGLTDETSKYLDIACAALQAQMLKDFKAGALDQDRIAMLIGGGIGAHAVGKAVFQKLFSSQAWQNTLQQH